MATKRTHAELEGVHESRQLQVYGPYSKPYKKPRPSEPRVPKQQVHFSSVNAIKKRIRDITRRMERSPNLPANVRMDDERALAAYQEELAAAAEEKARQHMIKRYHMVRFFERQKATRHVKKFKKLLLAASTVEEVEEFKTQIHIAEVDLNYTLYFPLNQKYIGLYPRKVDGDGSKDNATEDEVPVRKTEIWTEVERRMEDGTLDQLRNDGTKNAAVQKSAHKFLPLRTKRHRDPEPESVLKEVTTTEKDLGGPDNRRMRRKKAREAIGGEVPRNRLQDAADDLEMGHEEDNSDGGFFEE